MVTRTTDIGNAAVQRTTQLPNPHEGVDPDQYDEPAGPIRVNPNQYPTPASPNAADWDAQQRKVADEEFQKEQEDWNQKQKMKYKDEEYRKEQERIQESKKEKSFGEKIKSAVKGKYDKYQAEREEERQAKREGMLKKLREGPQKPKPEQPKSKQKETRGQFHASGYGKGFVDPFPGGGNARPFPSIDPFGGMGGGGRGMALPKAGGNMFNFGFGGQQQSTHPGTKPVRQPPRPAPRPMKFPDPFAGIKAGSGKRSASMDPYSGLPGKKGPGMYKGSDKTAVKKKFRKMDDWMKF